MSNEVPQEQVADVSIRLSVIEAVLALLLARQEKADPGLLSDLHEAVIHMQNQFSPHAGPLHGLAPDEWAAKAERASGRLLSAASAFLAVGQQGPDAGQ
jgi:hypothetical protein